MKRNKKGFTLAELLIVVAIIAVLTAIAIPVFSSQLDKSKLATGTANGRSVVAEYTAECLSAATPTSPDVATAVSRCEGMSAELKQGCSYVASGSGIKVTGPGSSGTNFIPIGL